MMKVVRPRLLRWALVASMGVLPACSWLGGPEDVDIGPTLTELQPARMPDVSTPIPEVSLDQVEANYRSALEVAEDPVIRRKVLMRLAGLEMTRAEQRQLDASEAGQQYFGQAIAMYQELIEQPPEQGVEKSQQDALMYQLAKAYALDGRVEESAAVLDRLASAHTQSPFIAEAQFRRAERAFSNGDYAQATQGYRAVMDAGESSNFYGNSVYMHGWSLFKRGRYEESLESFTRVLDVMSEPPSEVNQDVVNEGDGSKVDLLTITGPQKNLVADTLHVMGLVFSYLDGAATIQATYQTLGERPYNHLLYQQLGDLYLEKRRYRDSAETFKYYVEQFPASDHAPGFSVRMIDVYAKGNFPSLLLPAKETFVHNYGIYSKFWAQKSDQVHLQLRPHLHTYIDELAKYEHAQAQKVRKLLVDNRSKLKPKDIAKSEADASKKFLQAARWYKEFAETFPDDKQTPNMVFLMAESLYEAKQLPAAFKAYEAVAYQYLDDKHGAEAGYSAILSAAEFLATIPADTQAEQHSAWADLKTQSALKFVDYYAADKRAPKVLTQAAKELLEQKKPEQAIDAATRITQWLPQVEVALRHTAWLVLGQSQFDTAHYREAEVAYQEVLKLLPNNDPTRSGIIERIAASIYKGAEQQLAADDIAGAVEQLLRVRDVAPDSEIAIKAQYDAVSYLMELAQWSQAEQELMDFRRRYPLHELTVTLPAKVVVVYEQLQDWSAAADELTSMSKSDKGPEVRRQSLYLSAEYYEKAEDITSAILRYRLYAHTYEDPFDQVMEARFKMSELYVQTKEPQKRKFWLRKLVSGDKAAGKQRTDRSRYLGAFASSELAEDTYQTFARIPLKLPLKRSLKQKKTALKTALKAYEDILEYEVAEFSTLANYRIGAIYSQLSRDLMASQRPKNLDELALEQYEILLEEQAFPFEEQSIAVHQNNAQRSWSGIYDHWVKQSFSELEKLLPGRYNKKEITVEFSEAIY